MKCLFLADLETVGYIHTMSTDMDYLGIRKNLQP